VRYFTYINWDTGFKDDVWDGVVRNHEWLRVDWCDVDGIYNWPVDPPHHKSVMVLVKKGKMVNGLNDFLKLEILHNFFHDTEKGWVPRCVS